MRHLHIHMLLLIMGMILALSACSGGTTTSQLCFSQALVTNVQSTSNNVSFTVTFDGGKTSTFSVQKDAFGDAPATLKNGDVVSFCANQVGTDNHGTITLSQFVVGTQPRPTSTP